MMKQQEEDSAFIRAASKFVRIMVNEFGLSKENCKDDLSALFKSDRHRHTELAQWWAIKELLGEDDIIAPLIWQAAKDAEHYAENATAGIAKMNKSHAVVNVAGKTRILTEDSTELRHPNDFHNFYKGQTVEIDDKSKPISHIWMNSPDRRTYKQAVFLPGGKTPPDTYNFWKGWGADPNQNASCQLFLFHLLYICEEDEAVFNYLIGWLAHIIQHPQDKPGVAVVIRGAKGVGKDTIAEYMAKVLGRAAVPVISQTDHLTGRFTAHLETALLANVQEAVWAGSRRDEGALKSLITAPTLSVERKGIDVVQARSFVRVLITSNENWVVPATNDERRWFVIDADCEKPGRDYFNALYAEMEGDGPAALLHTLQTLDLTGFDVRNVPDTAGLAGQKVNSLTNINRWWYELLCDGCLPGTMERVDEHWSDKAIEIQANALRASYAGWMGDNKWQGDRLGPNHFGISLREMCPDLKRRRSTSEGRPWTYTMPPLSACKQAFEHWLGSPSDWEGE